MFNETRKGIEMKGEHKEPSSPKPGQGVVNPMRPIDIVLIIFYLILFSIILLYGLMQVWPSPTPAGSSTPRSSSITFLIWTFSISDKVRADEVRMLLIVAMAGALGGLMHALRSVYWYVGHQTLVRRWVPMYILLPFVGAILGIVFYLVIRGGFFSPQATAEQTSPFGFAALAALAGMFSEQAVLKLKQVFETLLTKAPKGENAKPQEKE